MDNAVERTGPVEPFVRAVLVCLMGSTTANVCRKERGKM